MNPLFRSILPIAFSALAVAGCAGSDAAHETSDEETSSSSGALSLANSWQHMGTQFDCNAGISAKVTKTSRRHYYSFAGEAGQNATFALDGTWPNVDGSVLLVSDEYGNVLAQRIKYTSNSAKVSLTFPTTANYFVWISAYNYTDITHNYNYTLASTCSEPSCDVDSDCHSGERCSHPVCITVPCDFPGTCVQSNMCAEYTTSDGRFYAKNFTAGSYDAAKQWVTADPEVVSSHINLGTCNGQPTESCDGESAVCGAPYTADGFSTFESRCAFETVVRQNAGSTGEYKGKYTAGACEDALFCATATPATDPTGPTYYYAQNFATQADAQSFLDTSFPGATSSSILATRCDVASPCPLFWNPVCGTIKSGTPTTYSNSCDFQAAIRMDATGAVGAGSKGYYSHGACAPTCDYSDPHYSYITQDPNQCMVIKYSCTVGKVPFSNSCGCGCTDITQ